MNEWMMILLDIANNSLNANSSLVKIKIDEDCENFSFSVIDNGKGIKKENQKGLFSPFYTTRKTRTFGFGLPLLKEVVNQVEGTLFLKSEENKGTTIKVAVKKTHVDALPIGNIKDTLLTLILNSENTDICFEYRYRKNVFLLDTRDIRKALEVKKLDEPDILLWLKTYICEGIKNLGRENEIVRRT